MCWPPLGSGSGASRVPCSWLREWVLVNDCGVDLGGEEGLQVALLVDSMDEFRQLAEDDDFVSQGIFAILDFLWAIAGVRDEKAASEAAVEYSDQVGSYLFTTEWLGFPFHFRQEKALQLHDAVDLLNYALALVTFQGDCLGHEDPAEFEVAIESRFESFATLVGIGLGEQHEELLANLLELLASLASLFCFAGLGFAPLLPLLLPLLADAGEGVFYVNEFPDLGDKAACRRLVLVPANREVVELGYAFEDFAPFAQSLLAQLVQLCEQFTGDGVLVKVVFLGTQ